jgi:hypothetical protein
MNGAGAPPYGLKRLTSDSVEEGGGGGGGIGDALTQPNCWGQLGLDIKLEARRAK